MDPDGVPCFCADELSLLGHDKLGHQLAGALARAGWLSRDTAGLAALTDDQLLALPPVGRVALARFRAVYGGRPSGRRSARARRRGDTPQTGARCGCPPGLLELGHDQLGHRTSYLLARAGLLKLDAVTVARMTDHELLQLRGLGSTGLARVREQLPARRGVDLRAACSG
jgi:hypothetical protein